MTARQKHWRNGKPSTLHCIGQLIEIVTRINAISTKHFLSYVTAKLQRRGIGDGRAADRSRSCDVAHGTQGACVILFSRANFFFVCPKLSHQMLSYKTSDLGKRPKFLVTYPIVLSMGYYQSSSEWVCQIQMYRHILSAFHSGSILVLFIR